MLNRVLHAIGLKVLHICKTFGSFTLFLAQFIKTVISTRLKTSALFEQMNSIGVNSIPIVFLTGMGTGMVFALQSYIGFKRVGGSQFIGSVVALAMARELGPVLTGLMVTGRSGSAITAEIGTMRITEQIDALTTLRINPFQYLIAPRIIAGLLVIPCLTLFCILCGVIGGYIVCVLILDLNPEEYISSIQSFVRISDVINGVIKSCAFGFIITSVGTYMGYHTRGGARGVGVATTNSVVISSVMILIADYVLTKLIEQI